MIHAVNIQEEADLSSTLAALGSIGTVSTPFPRTPRYVHVEASEEAEPDIMAISGVESCCCSDATVSLDFVSIKEDQHVDTTQPLTTEQWGLGYISGRDDLENYVYDATGEDVWIFNVDTPANPDIADFTGRCTVIHEHSNQIPLSFSHGTLTLGWAGGLHYGIAKKALLFNAAGFDGEANGSTSSVNAALNAVADYIEDNGPPVGAVVNCSFSFSGFLMGDPFSAVINRLDSLGAIIITSAGNNGTTPGGSATNYWPLMNSKVLGVGAHNKESARPSWSNQGNYLDLYAPGVDCAAMNRHGGIGIASGTSISCPYVCGMIACALEAGIEDVRGWLIENAIPGVVTGVSSGTDAVAFKPTNLLGETGPIQSGPEPEELLGKIILSALDYDFLASPTFDLNEDGYETGFNPFHIIDERFLYG